MSSLHALPTFAGAHDSDAHTGVRAGSTDGNIHVQTGDTQEDASIAQHDLDAAFDQAISEINSMHSSTSSPTMLSPPRRSFGDISGIIGDQSLVEELRDTARSAGAAASPLVAAASAATSTLMSAPHPRGPAPGGATR